MKTPKEMIPDLVQELEIKLRMASETKVTMMMNEVRHKVQSPSHSRLSDEDRILYLTGILADTQETLDTLREKAGVEADTHRWCDKVVGPPRKKVNMGEIQDLIRLMESLDYMNDPGSPDITVIELGKED